MTDHPDSRKNKGKTAPRASDPNHPHSTRFRPSASAPAPADRRTSPPPQRPNVGPATITANSVRHHLPTEDVDISTTHSSDANPAPSRDAAADAAAELTQDARNTPRDAPILNSALLSLVRSRFASMSQRSLRDSSSQTQVPTIPSSRQDANGLPGPSSQQDQSHIQRLATSQNSHHVSPTVSNHSGRDLNVSANVADQRSVPPATPNNLGSNTPPPSSIHTDGAGSTFSARGADRFHDTIASVRGASPGYPANPPPTHDRSLFGASLPPRRSSDQSLFSPNPPDRNSFHDDHHSSRSGNPFHDEYRSHGSGNEYEHAEEFSGFAHRAGYSCIPEAFLTQRFRTCSFEDCLISVEDFPSNVKNNSHHSIIVQQIIHAVNELMPDDRDFSSITHLFSQVQDNVSNPVTPVFNHVPSANALRTASDVQKFMRNIALDFETATKRASLIDDVIYRIVVTDFATKLVRQPFKNAFACVIAFLEDYKRRLETSKVELSAIRQRFQEDLNRKFAQICQDAANRERQLLTELVHHMQNSTMSEARVNERYTTISNQKRQYLDDEQARLETEFEERVTQEFHEAPRKNAIEIQMINRRIQHVQFQAKVVSAYLTHFDSVLQTFSTIVRKFFTDYGSLLAGVIGRLNQSVVHPISRRNISQPLSNADIPGFYHNLKSVFLVPTIRDFLERLVKVIHYENKTDNFEEGIGFAERERDEWAHDELWQKFMNPEVFFSLIPIMGWKRNADRQKWMQRLLTKIEQLDADELTNSTTAVVGPLFMEVKEIGRINRESSTIAQFNDKRNGNDQNAKGPNNGNSNKFQNKKNGNKNSVTFQNVKVESNPSSVAYAAASEPAGSTTYRLIELPAKPMFSDKVPRNQNIWVTKDGKEHSYVALPSECPVCYPTTNSANSKELHLPKCTKNTCGKCKLQGHMSFQCLQIVAGNGNKQKKDNKET